MSRLLKEWIDPKTGRHWKKYFQQRYSSYDIHMECGGVLIWPRSSFTGGELPWCFKCGLYVGLKKWGVVALDNRLDYWSEVF